MRTYSERLANIKAKVRQTKKAYAAIAVGTVTLSVFALLVCSVFFWPELLFRTSPAPTLGPALQDATNRNDYPMATIPGGTSSSDVQDPTIGTRPSPTEPFFTVPTVPTPTDPNEPTSPLDPVPTDPTEPTQPPVDTSDWVTVYCVVKGEYRTQNDDAVVTTKCTYDQYGNLLNRVRVKNGRSTVLAVFTYDGRGNILTSPGSAGTSGITYTYDEHDRVVSESWKQNQGDMLKLYFYDEMGNLIRIESYTNDVLQTINTMTYDADGRILTEIKDNIDNTYITDYSYYWEYDLNGNLILYQRYHGDLLRSAESYTYDDAGRIISMQTEKDGEIVSEVIYIYNSEGLLIREDSRHPGITLEGADTFMTTTSVTYEYCQDGKLLQMVLYEEGKAWCWYNYDDKGNLISIKTKYSDKIWTYDEFGNLIAYDFYYEGVWSSGTTYTYDSFLAPPWMAEQIQSQQAEYLEGIIYWC